ncbi:MAG: penicillin-binding protein 1A [Pseudomonadota bacterium]
MTKLFRALLSSLVGAVFLFTLAAVAFYVKLERKLPSVSELEQVQLAQPLQVYTRDGKRLAEFGDERRIPIDHQNLPPVLVQAILAAEDSRFFEHPGFDSRGLTRAAWELVRTGEPQQGGSTITMQVARNFFLSREKTFNRKAREILLAVRIEQNFSKEEILGLYVNKIFLGERAYGFGAAAQIYFGRPLERLDVAEIALLAGLPKAPSRDNPLANPERARERRDYVLARMHALGYLEDDAFQRALRYPDTAGRFGFMAELEAPDVAEMARAWAVQRYGEAAYTNGYRIFTTIDSGQQISATRALRTGLLNYDRRHGYRGPTAHLTSAELADPAQRLALLNRLPRPGELRAAVRLADGDYLLSPQGEVVAAAHIDATSLGRQFRPATGDVVYLAATGDGWEPAQPPAVDGAFVALEPTTGAITALVGGYDFQRSKFNRALQAKRQPGSTFKPFIYAAALAAGYTAASVINDAPVAYPANVAGGYWRPENYTRRFYGPTRLREALAQSRNVVAVRLLDAVGVDFTRRYCLRFGFTQESLPPNLSLALGTASLTPLELAAAYGPLANGGYRITPFWIERVLDAQGGVVWQAPRVVPCDAECDSVAGDETQAAPRAIPATDAYILNSMLRDVIASGTAARARSLGRPDLAGKTGTTNDARDAWFVGFNRSLLALSWVGFDQPRSLGKGETGARAALPIWMDFMATELARHPVMSAQVPDGIVSMRIDRHTGLRAQASDPDSMFEWFSADRLPAAGDALDQDLASPHPPAEATLF